MNLEPDRVVVWFSCGAASAVAAKLAVERYAPRVEVVYCDTFATEHPDNRRFFSDVQDWIGRPIRLIRSAQYPTINEVFERERYMSGIKGARCTVEMKKAPRLAFQHPNDLIDRGVSKAACLDRLRTARIALPAMYGLGFDHNNCLGCVKATSPGYWNRTRRLFPEVFAQRAAQSRALGVRLARVKGERVFLDMLPPDADAPDDAIDCGPVCQTVR